MSLNGKRVVLVGGTSGIGLATAELAVAQGAQVVVASSTQDKVDDAVKRLGDSASGQRVDVTRESDVAAFFTETGSFDHLVYTAGEGLLNQPIAELSVSDAKKWFEIRYWGAFTAAKYAAPNIRTGGSIVLTSGSVAQRPAPGLSIPASVTAAGESLVRALAVELAPIRVNAVRPGVTQTPLWANTGVPDPEAFYGSVGPGLPVGRVATAEEVAAAYLFVLDNGFVTGTTVSVDGGALLV